MENLLTVIGLVAGVISGYFVGKYWGYYSLNQTNTFGGFENPELDEISEVKKRGTMGKGDTVVMVFFILFALAFGCFFIYLGLAMSGVVQSALTTSGNVKINGSAGTMYCVGGFALFLGLFLLFGLLTGNVRKG